MVVPVIWPTIPIIQMRKPITSTLSPSSNIGQAIAAKNTRRIDTKDDFYDFFTPASAEKPEIHGGFAVSHFSGDVEVEEQLADDLAVTVRCIPLSEEYNEEGECPFTGKPSKKRVVFAKAY